MEQARCWMWTKQKHGLNFHVQAPSSTTNTKAAGYGDSWEEQAFAEDAAGALGECIWPPRSYTCTFCRREFRSAQALGGHMNVHRRDRARLKQSSNPHDEIIHLPNPSSTSTTPLDVVHDLHYPPHQICAFLDHKPNRHVHVLAPPSPASRVLVPPVVQEKSLISCGGNQKALVSPKFSCPIVQEHKKRIMISSSSLSTPPSWSNMAADTQYFHLSDPPKHEGDNISTREDSGCGAKRDYVKADLSVSLNLFVCRARPDVSGSKEEEEEEEEEEEALSCKRLRTDLTTPFFLKPSSVVDRHGPPRPEVLQLSPNSIEELDLELRLGADPPKVK